MVIYKELKNVAYIKSKKKGLTYIPESGWLYADVGDGGWKDDDTLTVTGEIIKSNENQIYRYLMIYRRRTNLS